MDGEFECWIVGLSVGLLVGDKLGLAVGFFVGDNVGRDDGISPVSYTHLRAHET